MGLVAGPAAAAHPLAGHVEELEGADAARVAGGADLLAALGGLGADGQRLSGCGQGRKSRT